MNDEQHNLPMVTDKDMLMLLDPNRKEYPGRMRFTVCRAAREIYGATTDEDIRLKCRYISMLASVMTRRLDRVRPGFLTSVYPRRDEFNRIMQIE